MKKIARKAFPIVCAVSAPFLIHADEAIEPSAMLCAANTPSFSGNKLASNTSMQSSNGSEKSAMDRTITPPAGPLVSNGADVYLTADFIWWKAQQDGLAFAYDGVTAQPGTVDAQKGHLHQPHFKYEPGFKLGLGVLSGHDNWDMLAEYTWLHVDADNTKNEVHYKGNGSPSTDYNALRSVQTDVKNDGNVSAYKYYDEVSGKWSLNFNVLDLDLGRNFWVSKRLTLRPHVGLKFSWLKQDFDVHGEQADLFFGSSRFASTHQDHDLKQFGVGLRAGVNSAFYLWNKWSIFGDLSWTALWNDFKVSRHDSHNLTTTSPEVKDANVHYKPFTVTGVMEVALGLRFETIFSKGRYMYLLQAGWENQVWFDQGQFINFNTPNNPGNLSLGGLTIKTGFYF